MGTEEQDRERESDVFRGRLPFWPTATAIIGSRIETCSPSSCGRGPWMPEHFSHSNRELAPGEQQASFRWWCACCRNRALPD